MKRYGQTIEVGGHYSTFYAPSFDEAIRLAVAWAIPQGWRPARWFEIWRDGADRCAKVRAEYERQVKTLRSCHNLDKSQG